ncbi:MAG: DUF4145 domain-containing protein [Candidatus Paceibacterota bacterium]|jgi:hypothetical protein
MSETEIGKVKCRIPGCGKSYPILAAHITKTHGLSTAEYLRRFPGAKLSSDEWKKKVSSSIKDLFSKDPTMQDKVASRTFDFVKNKKLTPLLQRDYRSARICLKNSLWKPSTILYGSIIEAILMEKHSGSKDFYEAIDVAYKKGDISEIENHKIHVIRDLRNFVHLKKELEEGGEIDEHWAKTAGSICESIIGRFRKE